MKLPRDLAQDIATLAALVPDMVQFRHDRLRAALLAQWLRDQGEEISGLENIATPLVFTRSARGYCVGLLGKTRTLACSLMGVSAAWQAIHNGALVNAHELSPRAKYSRNVVRNAIRRSGTRWAREAGCRALAVEFERIRVEHDGTLIYRPEFDSPRIITE